MKKKLKLGFAMGGGVSLGTFSGAALSETIKQAVLHAGYYDENSTFQLYDDVEIDVFSGASAGSLSLAIMLRGLAHQSDTELEEAKTKLEEDDSIGFKNLAKDKQDKLVVAQVVQDLQEKIWVDEINMDKLLGTTDQQRKELTFEGGLLRKSSLAEIARKYFDLKEAYQNCFQRRKILSERVIFGSTLANLTGLLYNGDKSLTSKLNPNYIGVSDAFISRGHKELRVFDLFFKTKTTAEIDQDKRKHPPKWVRYHIGERQPGNLGNICTNAAWSRIIATSIASGSFPFAFEPTVLERFKFEFGEEWPDELTPEVCELATGKTAEESYPFTYIDGGAFNNEPVREAFRMAALLDAEDTTDFDRLVVFVDPTIGERSVQFRIPVHQKYKIKKPRRILGDLDGYDLERLPTLDRLLSHLPTVISTILNEGSLNENNKIRYISELFSKKEDYQGILCRLVDNAKVDGKLIIDLKKGIDDCLRKEKLNSILPNGSITLLGQLTRVVKENPKDLPLSKKQIIEIDNGRLLQFSQEELPVVLKALLFIMVDFLLDLAGKNRNNKIVAIAPVVKVNGKLEMQSLPGSYLGAFAGFISKEPNRYAVSLAKHSTQLLLKELKVLPDDFKLTKLDPWEGQQKYKEEFEKKLIEINKRVDNLLLNSDLIDLLPGVDSFVLSKIARVIKEELSRVKLEHVPFDSFVFQIEVDSKAFELDGKERFNDVHTIYKDGKHYLITELNYYYIENQELCWRGLHEQGGFLVVENSSLFDKAFCEIQLPGEDQVKKARLLPNPIFLCNITEDDRGSKKLNSLWTIKAGIEMLEDNLLVDAIQVVNS